MIHNEIKLADCVGEMEIGFVSNDKMVSFIDDNPIWKEVSFLLRWIC